MNIVSDDYFARSVREQNEVASARLAMVRSFDWLPAKIARDWVAEHLSCDEAQVERALLNRMHFGLKVRLAGFRAYLKSEDFQPENPLILNDVVFPNENQRAKHLFSGALIYILRDTGIADRSSDWDTGDFLITIGVADPPSEVYPFNPQMEFALTGLRIEKVGLIEAFSIPVSNLPSQVTPGLRKSNTRPAGPGRTVEYDWLGAFAHVAAIANHSDGLRSGRGAQAAIVRIMADWFAQKAGDGPGETELKNRANQILQAIDELARSKVGKA